MSRLRDRMQEDLKLAGLCENTQKTYLRGEIQSPFRQVSQSAWSIRGQGVPAEPGGKAHAVRVDIQRVCSRIVFPISTDTQSTGSCRWS